MKGSMLRSAVVGVCAVLILLASSSCLVAETWVWKADNHKDDVSYFTDSKTTFTVRAEQGGRWFWDDPAPGMVSFRNTTGWQRTGEGAGVLGRGLGRSSDFGDALDLNKGVTVAARVKALSPFSAGTICLSVENESTATLPDGSTHLWVGWDAPDTVWITRRHNRARTELRSFDSSVKFEGRWSIWTVGAKRVGDTVAWDVWIDGVHQGADQRAPDGSMHTMVFTQSTDMGTTVSIGQRTLVLYPHDTAWDYVAITNEGVIPGWTGGVEPSVEEERPIEQWRQDMLTKSAISRVERLLRRERYADVIETCDDALERYKNANPHVVAELNSLKTVALHENAPSKGFQQAIDEVLSSYKSATQGNVDPGVFRSLMMRKILAYRRVESWAEIIKICADALDRLNSEKPQTASSSRWNRDIAELKVYKAEALFRNGKIDEALAFAEKSLGEHRSTDPERDSDPVKGLLVLSVMALIADGRPMEAIQLCDTTIREYQDIGPETFILELRLLRIHAWKIEDRIDEAIEAISVMQDETLSAAERARLRHWIAQIYYEAKQYAKASAEFSNLESLSVTPHEKGRASFYIGLCHRKEGNLNEARRYMLETILNYRGTEWESNAREMLRAWDQNDAEGR